MQRLTEQRYHALAAKRGFEWLGPMVTNANTKTFWRCPERHDFEAVYGHIYSGRGCPRCAPNLRLTEAAFRNVGAIRGIRWAGSGLPTANETTSWECGKSHVWQTTYASINRGNGCRVCSGRRTATTQDYQSLAASCGFSCVTQGRNNHAKSSWQCSVGHQWEASYTQLRATGSGCPACYQLVNRPAQIERSRKRPTDYHAMAEARGLQWLGPETLNVKTKTQWLCGIGHLWMGSYGDLQVGQGCPKCVDIVNGHKVSKPQRALAAMVNGDLNVNCGRRSIDVALSDQRIAIEYDAWYWHADRDEQDKERELELLSAGWRVLRIRSNANLPLQAALDTAITLLLSGASFRTEIVLSDWGVGPTFVARKTA